MTMKKLLGIGLALLISSAAFAADNAVIVTPGIGVTMKSKDIGSGVQAMQPILSDASGNTLLTTLGADAVSNTLTGIPVYSRSLYFNGTTWDRWQGAVTNAGTFAVQATLAAETTKVIGTVRVASGGIASGGIAAGALAAGACVDGCDLTQGAIADAVVAAGATGSHAAKLRRLTTDLDAAKTSLASIDTKASQPLPAQANTTTNIGMVNVSAAANGGATPQSAISVNNTTAVVVKAGAGTLYGAQLGNIGSVPLYLKIYNATSATCGSGTPVKRLLIPKAATAADGGGSNITFGPMGIAFGTGITYCLTAAIADNDTTAPAANVALVNLDYN